MINDISIIENLNNSLVFTVIMVKIVKLADFREERQKLEIHIPTADGNTSNSSGLLLQQGNNRRQIIDKDNLRNHTNLELGQKVRGHLSDLHEDKEAEEEDTSDFDSSLSESSEESSESDSEDINRFTSPSKVMTRKIASNRDRASANNTTNERTCAENVMTEKSALNTVNSLLQKLSTEKQLSTQASSDFSLPGKSPIVISKEGGSFKDSSHELRNQQAFNAEESFQLHGKFSSHDMVFGAAKQGVHQEDEGSLSDGSLSSYSDLKISSSSEKQNKRTAVNNDLGVGNRDRTQSSGSDKTDDDTDDDSNDKFDDEDEWNDLTPKAKSPARGATNSSGTTRIRECASSILFLLKMIRNFPLFCSSLIGQDEIYWCIPQSEYTAKFNGVLWCIPRIPIFSCAKLTSARVLNLPQRGC